MLKRIFWGVDVFSGVPSLNNKIMKMISELSSADPKIKIEAGYVLSPDQVNWTGTFSPPWIKQYKPIAEQAMQKILQDAPFKTAKSHIISQSHYSGERTVQKLIKAARDSKSNCIAVATRARSSTERFWMGSFTETLLFHANLPVLIVNPETSLTGKINQIIFASDLSPHAKKHFDLVVSLAKQIGAKIMIFHKMPNPLEPVIQAGVYMMGGGWVALPTFFDKEEKERQKRAHEWQALARKKGVECEVDLIAREAEIAKSLTDLAKRYPDSMVALASMSGPVSSVLLGSVSRQVVRNCTQPILIFPSHLRKVRG